MPFNNAGSSNWLNDPESSQLLWMNYVIEQNKNQSMTFWKKKKLPKKSQDVSVIARLITSANADEM